ncbi:hypothetical protein BX600DRAFT_437702 [Xylariales sp. PMI_506]|nr:hypothetical protein BX600DRAFT_437702 [Xylariales sp. PMI_506]
MIIAPTRTHYTSGAVLAIFLLFALVNQHDQVRHTIHGTWRNSWSNDKTFYDIALKHGTDKVTVHQYGFLYDKYLPTIRNRRVKILEIGLGCDMKYGPGRSYYTWTEYFPDIDMYYMEYDTACVSKWASEVKGATIYAGNQEDPMFLQKFIDEIGGDFDLVIDDGGHTMVQQQSSLEKLWKIVKPGGIYVIEDLQTSFIGSYGGDESGGKNSKVWTMMKYIYELIDDKMTPDGTRHPMSKEMRGIDCQREICAFYKKGEGEV